MAGDSGPEHLPADSSTPGAGHQNRGVNVRAIGGLAIGLILLTGASIFMLNGLYRHFETRENSTQASPSGADADARKLPPEPRLQERAVRDLQQIRAAEDQILHSYGWVDQKKGIVRIPIDRAIDLLAQRRVPLRGAQGTPNNAGNGSVPAETGLGSNVH